MASNTPEDLKQLSEDFSACREMLTALGDENRQHLLLIMLEGPCFGSRVIDIAKRTHLSRPAVSHHIKILKDAGIIRSRKEGTMIYYYLDPDMKKLNRLYRLAGNMKRLAENAPERKYHVTEPDE